MELPHLKKRPRWKVDSETQTACGWLHVDFELQEQPIMGPENKKTAPKTDGVPRGFIEVTHRQKPLLVNVAYIHFVQPAGASAMIIGDIARWKTLETYEDVKRKIHDAS